RAIESLPRGLDHGAVLPRPQPNAADRFEQRAAELGQLVFHLRRDGREYGAGDEPVALQAPQGERQHALRDRAERATDFVEAPRTLTELDDNQNGPLVADPGQHLADRAAILG